MVYPQEKGWKSQQRKYDIVTGRAKLEPAGLGMTRTIRIEGFLSH